MAVLDTQNRRMNTIGVVNKGKENYFLIEMALSSSVDIGSRPFGKSLLEIN